VQLRTARKGILDHGDNRAAELNYRFAYWNSTHHIPLPQFLAPVSRIKKTSPLQVCPVILDKLVVVGKSSVLADLVEFDDREKFSDCVDCPPTF
jgi:hypothetical protein